MLDWHGRADVRVVCVDIEPVVAMHVRLHHPDDPRITARAIATRLGMFREGVEREAFVVNGTSHNSEVWSSLAYKWMGRSGTATAS